MSHQRPLSRHELYELCVQSPRHLVPMIRAVHGRQPEMLGEDFAGTAALSHAWVDAADTHRAVAVDSDRATLAWRGEHPRIQKHAADVLERSDPVDVLFVGNFSIGYHHTRRDVLAYLRHVRARLTPGGVFLCDTYGGETAFLTGDVHRDHWITEGEHAGKRVRYTWEQREADPVTAMVTDVCHFRVDKAGVIEQQLDDAFVYRWRLWSVPELTDALLEAGFEVAEVYDKTPDAMDDDGNAYLTPVTDGASLEDSFIVCVAGRVR